MQDPSDNVDGRLRSTTSVIRQYVKARNGGVHAASIQRRCELLHGGVQDDSRLSKPAWRNVIVDLSKRDVAEWLLQYVLLIHELAAEALPQTTQLASEQNVKVSLLHHLDAHMHEIVAMLSLEGLALQILNTGY